MSKPDALASCSELSGLILRFSSAIGMDAFFRALVDVLISQFGASRVSLCRPYDPTEVYNYPWGLQATWQQDNRVEKSDDSNGDEGDDWISEDKENTGGQKRFSRFNTIPKLQQYQVYDHLRALEAELDPIIENGELLKIIELPDPVSISTRGAQSTTCHPPMDRGRSFSTNPGVQSGSSGRRNLAALGGSPWSSAPVSPIILNEKEADKSPFFSKTVKTGEKAIIHILLILPGENRQPIGLITFVTNRVPFPSSLMSLLVLLQPHFSTMFLHARTHFSMDNRLASSHSDVEKISRRSKVIRSLQKRGKVLFNGKDRVVFDHLEAHTGSKARHLLKMIVDAVPVQVFTADSLTGNVTWASWRTLAFRGQTAEQFCKHPEQAIHPRDRSSYERAWKDALATGEPKCLLIQVKRFDSLYRVFFMRVLPLRDVEDGPIRQWYCTMMDIHDQRMAELDVEQRARERSVNFGDGNTPSITFTLSSTKGMVSVNKKWTQYTGLTVSETLNSGYLNAIHPDDYESAKFHIDLKGEQAKFRPREQSPGVYSTEVRIKNAAGEYRWHLVIYTRSESLDEPTGLYFGYCTDIQEQKSIQENLKQAKDAAQKTIESKTMFLSNMSHEIRTPLIGISGMVAFLLDTPLSDEQLDYCHTISSSSEALLMVINDILDISKVESGKMSLQYSWFQVRRFIEEANELVSPMAISKNLELNYITDNDVPVWVKGDRVRLRQVVLNLIGNAVKFTDTGEVYTRCSLESIDDKEAVLKFEIHDTGRGFTENDTKRMFKPFSQLQTMSTASSSSTASNPPGSAGNPSGTGLGLVISRQLVELHGGQLSCHGEKDKGSVFFFTCVVGIPTIDDRPSEELLSKTSKMQKKSRMIDSDLNILVVCQFERTSESIAHHIRATVTNPERCAIEYVATLEQLRGYVSDPTVMWTHCVVNVSDVEFVFNFILEALKTGSIKRVKQFLFLTNSTQRNELQARLKQLDNKIVEKFVYLQKPLRPSRYSVVFDPAGYQEASHDHKLESAQEVVRSQREVFESLARFGRLRKLRILLAEDNLVNQKVISKFLERSGISVDVTPDGSVCTQRILGQPAGYYDLVLCDLDMPRKNGFEVCREIRRWEKENGYAAIPLLALSAYVMSEMEGRCKEAGFTKYISKPVDFSDLGDAIIQLLRDSDVTV